MVLGAAMHTQLLLEIRADYSLCIPQQPHVMTQVFESPMLQDLAKQKGITLPQARAGGVEGPHSCRKRC